MFFTFAGMRRMFSIFMLTVYLFSTMEFFAQLLKIPIFVEHFVEHMEKDRMSFVDYLVHHYGGHEQDDDWDTDMKLPFMTHSETFHGVFNFAPFRLELGEKRMSDTEQSLAPYRQPGLKPPYLATIWQPPKSC